MSIKFEGFSNADMPRLEGAVMLLMAGSKKAKQALLSGDLAAYQKWFDGTGNNAHLFKVSTIVNEIDDALTTKQITFVNATGNAIHRDQQGLCGYVFLINNGPGLPAAHFGSGMRIMMVPRTHNGNVGDLAETMYHELAHKVGGVRDVTYKIDTCLSNAKNDPRSAADNAENYNRFFGEFTFA
jgi:hypothetical protein